MNQSTTVQPTAKQAWTTPAIETYDVAEFTLATAGAGQDATTSAS